MKKLNLGEIAAVMTRIQVEASEDLAGYLRSLPPEAWNEPSACSEWCLLELARHVARGNLRWTGKAREVLNGRSHAGSDEVLAYRTPIGVDALPSDQLVGALVDSSRRFRSHMELATEQDLHQMVELAFGAIPLWMMTTVAAMESAIHNWDARAWREPDATIPTTWAVQLSADLVAWVPTLSRSSKDITDGTYCLKVGKGIGPISLAMYDGEVQVNPHSDGPADVTLHITPDQYVRLLWGRLILADAIDAGLIRVEGSVSRALGLNQLFCGL